MSKRTTKLAVLAVAGFSIAVLLSMPLLAEEKKQRYGEPPAATAAPDPAKPHSMQGNKQCAMQGNKQFAMRGKCMQKIDQAIKAIDAATKAVEAGQKATALAELKKARDVVALCRKTMLSMGKGKIINARCPIMGTKLDAGKVPQNLTRMHMGKKVGFCCAGCPQKWYKLSQEEKAKKLGTAVSPAKTDGGCCPL